LSLPSTPWNARIPAYSLYADDVILFCHPTVSGVIAIKGILQLFGHAFGLKVNFGKSSTSLLNCNADTVAPAIELLGCPVVVLPLIYVGIPLTIRRPTATQLQPLVAKMAAALPTSKAKLMNKAGRLAFIKAVLNTIPLHQLLVLNPTKKILTQLQWIQRAHRDQWWQLAHELGSCVPAYLAWRPWRSRLGENKPRSSLALAVVLSHG
jgi:hypothetical protein